MRKRGALTYWKPQREELVREAKERDRQRGTHRLASRKGSGHRKKASK